MSSRNSGPGWLGVFFLLAVVFIGWLLLKNVGLAQSEPEAIRITPWMWLESKWFETPAGETEYWTEGWTFEEGGYWMLGSWHKLRVNQAVYNQILHEDRSGVVHRRICRFAYADGEPAAVASTCKTHFQQFIPLAINAGGQP